MPGLPHGRLWDELMQDISTANTQTCQDEKQEEVYIILQAQKFQTPSKRLYLFRKESFFLREMERSFELHKALDFIRLAKAKSGFTTGCLGSVAKIIPAPGQLSL